MGESVPIGKLVVLALSAQLWTQIIQKDKTPKLDEVALTLSSAPRLCREMPTSFRPVQVPQEDLGSKMNK